MKRFTARAMLPYVCCFFIFFLSFFFNIFGVGPGGSWFGSFQESDSALIVRKTAECKGKLDYDGPVVSESQATVDAYRDEKDCSLGSTRPYESQYGLQARVIAMLAPSDANTSGYFKVVEMVCAALTSIVFVGFAFRVRQLFGVIPAVVSVSFIALSPWIVGFSRNMYWVSFSLFLPFVFSFIFYEAMEKKRLPLFYGILALIFFLRFLNGYEYAPTLVLSALAPIVFYKMRAKKWQLRDIMRPALMTISSGVVGFSLALFINVLALAGYYGSLTEAYSAVSHRAESRASGAVAMQPYVIGGFKVTQPEVYGMISQYYDLDKLADGAAPSYVYTMLSILNYATLPAVSVPFSLRQPVGSLLQSIAALVIIGSLTLRWLKKKGHIHAREARAFHWFYVIGLVGSLSWLVLMPGHMYPHAHINGIIFYIPLMLVSYVIIGIAVDVVIKKARRSHA